MSDIKEKILVTFEKAESFTPAWERVTFFSWNDMLYLKDALDRAEAAEAKLEAVRVMRKMNVTQILTLHGQHSGHRYVESDELNALLKEKGDE